MKLYVGLGLVKYFGFGWTGFYLMRDVVLFGNFWSRGCGFILTFEYDHARPAAG